MKIPYKIGDKVIFTPLYNIYNEKWSAVVLVVNGERGEIMIIFDDEINGRSRYPHDQRRMLIHDDFLVEHILSLRKM